MTTNTPEPQWKYRRIFIWAFTIANALALAYCIPNGREQIGVALVWLQALVVLIYLIAPTAEHIVRAIGEWKK